MDAIKGMIPGMGGDEESPGQFLSIFTPIYTDFSKRPDKCW